MGMRPQMGFGPPGMPPPGMDGPPGQLILLFGVQVF